MNEIIREFKCTCFCGKDYGKVRIEINSDKIIIKAPDEDDKESFNIYEFTWDDLYTALFVRFYGHEDYYYKATEKRKKNE